MRDHLIVIYLCGRCLWNSAAVCKPAEPPPQHVRCAACAVTNQVVDAVAIEGVLASEAECLRLTALCNSLEPEKHKAAFRMLDSLRGEYRVVVTAWAKKSASPPLLDVGAFRRIVDRVSEDPR